MKICILSLFLCLSAIEAFSQQSQDQAITGTVSDSVSHEKLAGATVLLKDGKAVLLFSKATDQNGNFSFTHIVKPGSYILEVAHVGFKTKKIHTEIKSNTGFNFNIKLVRSEEKLSELTITSERKLISQTNDKITYNISEGAISASDNLYNIISKVPGVSESGGSLLYQGKPLSIFLDSKSNNLSGNDLKEFLMGLQGASVDKLEILLNPSAKYDAQGGAVFNIKSVKNKNYGLTETVTIGVGTGTYFRNTDGLSVNYRDSTINIYGSYDFNHNKQFFLLKAFESFNANPATIQMVDDNRRTHNYNSVRFGIDYDVSKTISVGLLFKGFQNYRHRAVENISDYRPGNGLPDTVAFVNTITNAVFKSPSFNVFVKSVLNKKGAELIFNTDYFGYSKNWEDNFITSYKDHNGASIASPIDMADNSVANNWIKSATADFVQPFKNGRFEAGFKISKSKTDNEIIWKKWVNNDWKTDLTKTNHFIYTESISASYINLVQNLKKWTLQGGLRYESTRNEANSVTLHSIKGNSYDNFFPSLSVQFKPGKIQQYSFGYRRSIQRFGFDIINPFIVYQSEYSYNQGNPNIKPSFFNSFDLSYSYKNKIFINGGYSTVKDPISYGYKKDESLNTVIGSYFNFGQGNLLSGSISYTEKLLKGKWTSSNAVSFVHSEMPDFYGNMIRNNSYSINSTNNVSLFSQVSLEWAAFYNSSRFDGTVKQDAIYGASVGISKPVLKSKASIKLSCTDIFNTQIAHLNSQGSGIKLVSDWKIESRFVNLLFTYRFGSLSIKTSKNRKTGIEEEKGRMGAN